MSTTETQKPSIVSEPDSHDSSAQSVGRLRVVRGAPTDARRALCEDVRQGLGSRPYSLPPRYFYDAVGSVLFDRICDTPEYYLTRAEAGLLERCAGAYLDACGARELVELGSGAARKTRVLIEALSRHTDRPVYVPVDVSESMLVESAERLLRTYPGLTVRGIAGDYRRDLARAERSGRRLVAFLGSSIGNYTENAAIELLSDVRRQGEPDDSLLVGFDLVKSSTVLERAYNDAQGITAQFNRNVLAVLNRELSAQFELDAFDHVAFYEPSRAQIEMHLRARQSMTVRVRDLDMTVGIARGETIHTETSRKFTQRSACDLIEAGGYRLLRWDTSSDGAFAIALARPRR